VGGVKVWTRSAAVAVALTWVFALVGAQCGFFRLQPRAAHLNHPLTTSPAGEFTVNVGTAAGVTIVWSGLIVIGLIAVTWQYRLDRFTSRMRWPLQKRVVPERRCVVEPHDHERKDIQ
jgi:hypothetical protein